jgi:hypothetical protein
MDNQLKEEYDRIMDAYRSWSEGGLARPDYELTFTSIVQANPALLRYTGPGGRELLMKHAIDRDDEELIRILLEEGYNKNAAFDFGGQEDMTAYDYMQSTHNPAVDQVMGNQMEAKIQRISNLLNPNPAGGYRRKSRRGKSRSRKSKKSKKSKSKRATHRRH